MKIYERPDGRDSPLSEGLDYIAECDKTASNTFRTDHVGKGELVAALRQFQIAGEKLNKFKKAMFRKQSRQEAGLVGGADDNDDVIGPEYAQHDDLFHGVIGVCTEAGELAEFLADALEGKRRFDVANVREESGDLLWYLTRLMKWADTTFLTEMKRNIAKLRARHGAGGFDKSRDMNRDLASEAEVIRKGIG
jgi:NTP pyrophosphatase (non-canonical NTP hydrolase)